MIRAGIDIRMLTCTHQAMHVVDHVAQLPTVDAERLQVGAQYTATTGQATETKPTVAFMTAVFISASKLSTCQYGLHSNTWFQ